MRGGAPLQLFRDDRQAAWLNRVSDTVYIALFNLQDEKAAVTVDLSAFIGDGTYTALELWTKEEKEAQGVLSAEIEPHGAKLYKLI